MHALGVYIGNEYISASTYLIARRQIFLWAMDTRLLIRELSGVMMSNWLKSHEFVLFKIQIQIFIVQLTYKNIHMNIHTLYN